MPTHEKLHKAGDALDLASDTIKKGLTGRAGGPVEGAASIDTEAEGELPLGVTPSIAVPTGVSAADSATANAIDVTYTPPAGVTTCEIVVRKQSDDSFVKKVDSASSPETITGLTNGVTYDAYVRGVKTDGSIGRFAAKVSAAPA